MTARQPLSTAALMRAARALRFALVLQGAVRWGVLSAGGLLALLVIDDFLHLPQALRLPLAVVLVGFIGVEFYRKVLRLALRPFSPEQAARWLETHRGITGNVLINAYQFEGDTTHAEWRKYVQPLLASSSSILGEIPPQSLWLTPRLKKWFIALVLVAAGWALLVTVFSPLHDDRLRTHFPAARRHSSGRKLDHRGEPGRKRHAGGGGQTRHHGAGEVGFGFARQNASARACLAGWDRRHRIARQWSRARDDVRHGQAERVCVQFQRSQPAFHFYHRGRRFAQFLRQRRCAAIAANEKLGVSSDAARLHWTEALRATGTDQTLEVPVGSTVQAMVELSPDSPKLTWKNGAGAGEEMTEADGKWQLTRTVKESSAYELSVAMPGLAEPRLLGQGQITAVTDRPPEVDFVTQDRNRAVNPGGTLAVTIKATDDYGVASIALHIAPSDDPSTTRELKTWTYDGPPGQTEPVPETYTISLDPSVFTPGSTFLLTAKAADFSPAHQTTTSRPIILRVAGLDEMAVPQGDALEKLFELLKNTIAQQTQANGLTDNLALHLSEALTANDVPKHVGLMSTSQQQAQALGSSALDEAGQHDEGKIYVARLQPLVKGEMDLANGQLKQLPTATEDALSSSLASLKKRQVYILNSLIALLGQMASDRQQSAEAQAKKADDTAPAVSTQEELAKLKDELKIFDETQKKIIEASKTFKELNPEDLTSEQQTELGELAREEAKEAAYFQNKLTDLSKLPLQDFADGKLVGDMNEVYQEVQAARRRFTRSGRKLPWQEKPQASKRRRKSNKTSSAGCRMRRTTQSGRWRSLRGSRTFRWQNCRSSLMISLAT